MILVLGMVCQYRVDVMCKLLSVVCCHCCCSVDPYLAFLHAYAQSGKWEDCLRLCRFVDKKFLWACLAAMSLQAKEIATATTAYAALSNVSRLILWHHHEVIFLETVLVPVIWALPLWIFHSPFLCLYAGCSHCLHFDSCPDTSFSRRVPPLFVVLSRPLVTCFSLLSFCSASMSCTPLESLTCQHGCLSEFSSSLPFLFAWSRSCSEQSLGMFWAEFGTVLSGVRDRFERNVGLFCFVQTEICRCYSFGLIYS